ncbi:MAG: hypothetical protein Kow00124_05150 [Anaerolineae bacterium]
MSGLRSAIRAGRAVRALLMLLAALMLTPAALADDQTPPDPRFGVIETQDAPEAAADLGAAWTRVKFHWGVIQPEGPDQWVEPAPGDAAIDAELAAGRQVIGLLIGIPDWARDPDGLPRGLYLAPDDAGNSWAAFVREAVRRYRGRIDHWIVWNEPDIWDAAHPTATWAGSEADFARLLKVTYLAAKGANPEAVIHLAAFTHWWDALYDREPYFGRLLDELAADPEAAASGYYYDVATMHIYFNPATVYELLEQYRAIQAAHGLEHPFWLVETNAAPSSDPARVVVDPTFRISPLEQAAYMPQALALALAGGAERIGVYKLIDTPGDLLANPEPFGLLREDGSPRPAYLTTTVAFEQLAGAISVEWVDRGPAAQVVIEKPGQVVRLVWSRLPAAQTVRLPALASSAQVLDMWGNAREVLAEGGSYMLTLAAGECQETVGDFCMIGGPPLYVIEQGDGPAADADLSLSITPDAGVIVLQGAPDRLLLWVGVCWLVVMLAAASVLTGWRAGMALRGPQTKEE